VPLGTLLRTLVPSVVVAALIVGCGGAARTGQAGSDAGPAAVAGPAAAFAPPESLVYIQADKSAPGWKAMAPLRAGLEPVTAAGGGFDTLAFILSGYLLERHLAEGRSAFLGESAFVIISNEAGAEPSDDRVLRYLAYETITDRAAAERWLAHDFRPTGEDGAYKLYAKKESVDWVAAASDRILLVAATDADLHAAIARGAGGGARSPTTPTSARRSRATMMPMPWSRVTRAGIWREPCRSPTAEACQE
jgi:hypothetical protein